VGDEAVQKELGDRMERAAATASSLEVEQDSGSGPRCQDTILGNVNAQTRFEITSKQSNDLPLSRGYTLRSGEDINAVRHILMLPVQVPAVEGQVNAVRVKGGKPQHDDKGFVDSGCSRHITGNIAYLSDFKEFDGDDFCREKGIKREYSIAWTPQQNGVAERRNRTLIDSKLPTTFWAKAVSTACYVQNRVLVVKPHNKTPYELFRGFKPALSFMRPFGCHVTILNTLDSLGKFDGKSNEDFVVGYSLSSKAFRVHRRKSVRCIVMLIWKDTSYFDSPKMDVENGEPKTADDAQKQVEDGPNNKNVELDKFEDDNSTKDVNDAGQHVNTTSPDVNTGSLKLNVVGPSVNTASSNEQDSTKGEPEVDLGNITNSCIVPTTPNTRNHKDHPIDNVIGKVKSTVQTRRMTKPTSEQGFLSDNQMMDKFQMSSMGELTFFLGLQVQQKEDGIFISQDKYVTEILKKFNSSDVKSASTPIDLEKPLVKDGDADDVDVHL
ncbi:putative ribonuclease H-like domain-containing protein, partial [Tanacetum coccineum]